VEGKMEAELREGMQAWRKLHPKATLDEIETELNRQVALLRAAVLAETVATSKAVKAEAEVVCPVCGTQMKHEGQHKRKLKTYGGQALELAREYVRCPRCGQGFFPPGPGA
jgi:YgiT-type zinc finger domain-containing protein